MHKLFRLQETLFNTPHLITQESFDRCLAYLDKRNTDFEFSVSRTPFSNSNNKLDYDASTKTGYLNINGPLTYQATVMSALCGLTSYEQLQTDFKGLVDSGAKTIVLNVSSGGGESSHVFETANLIRDIADKNSVKLISYIDTIGASAAYALACVADEIVANPDASTGSIGVVVALRNSNKQLQNAGIEDTFLYAGQSKVPFDANGDWKAGFLEDIQANVDDLYNTFTAFVATNRNLSVDKIKSTEAKVFQSKQALELGLIDKIQTVAEFSSYVTSLNKPVQKTIVAKPVVTSAAVKPSTPKIQAPVVDDIPKGYRRNEVTGMLQAVTPITANVTQAKKVESQLTKLPLAKEQERIRRLSKFDPKAARHILVTSQTFSDPKFEGFVKGLEESMRN